MDDTVLPIKTVELYISISSCCFTFKWHVRMSYCLYSTWIPFLAIELDNRLRPTFVRHCYASHAPLGLCTFRSLVNHLCWALVSVSEIALLTSINCIQQINVAFYNNWLLFYISTNITSKCASNNVKRVSTRNIKICNNFSYFYIGSK